MVTAGNGPWWLMTSGASPRSTFTTLDNETTTLTVTLPTSAAEGAGNAAAAWAVVGLLFTLLALA